MWSGNASVWVNLMDRVRFSFIAESGVASQSCRLNFLISWIHNTNSTNNTNSKNNTNKARWKCQESEVTFKQPSVTHSLPGPRVTCEPPSDTSRHIGSQTRPCKQQYLQPDGRQTDEKTWNPGRNSNQRLTNHASRTERTSAKTNEYAKEWICLADEYANERPSPRTINSLVSSR